MEQPLHILPLDAGGRHQQLLTECEMSSNHPRARIRCTGSNQWTFSWSRGHILLFGNTRISVFPLSISKIVGSWVVPFKVRALVPRISLSAPAQWRLYLYNFYYQYLGAHHQVYCLAIPWPRFPFWSEEKLQVYWWLQRPGSPSHWWFRISSGPPGLLWGGLLNRVPCNQSWIR